MTAAAHPALGCRATDLDSPHDPSCCLGHDPCGCSGHCSGSFAPFPSQHAAGALGAGALGAPDASCRVGAAAPFALAFAAAVARAFALALAAAASVTIAGAVPCGTAHHQSQPPRPLRWLLAVLQTNALTSQSRVYATQRYLHNKCSTTYLLQMAVAAAAVQATRHRPKCLQWGFRQARFRHAV